MRAARSRKPVIAAVAGLNASAAYWVTAGASAIYGTPSALIGSIGVYTVRASIARQLEREGVDVEVFSAGRFKAEDLPVLPVTDPERKATQARVDETYDTFASDVAAGRRVSVATVRGGYGEGRVVSAKEAARLGMIDGIAVIEDTLAIGVDQSGTRALADDESELRARIGLSGDDADDELRQRLERY
jgi:signal peptide peptidase SppA